MACYTHLTQAKVGIPTVLIMKKMTPKIREKYPSATFQTVLDNLTRMHEVGMVICVGTDANIVAGLEIPHGTSIHDEMELMSQSGMSVVNVLRAATSVPAKYFGLTDRREIKEGKRADLTLVEGNPVEDIHVTRNVKHVWIRGCEGGLELCCM
ncbi:hypothetical protein B0T17DRAFT_621176 [Bombardia bombarda]|uniref:Amidohydrolase-related domain-containing protein n=1 Tax=Bombardia bombarda TaxID=252184 RepID=A0AA39TX14_9PEZI|nr:hypothetical protein B0T17DRAFT_621176 [Bombardia bombarda]